MRAGEVTTLALDADVPLGVQDDPAFSVQRLPLEPGDRLVFVTDGILDRHDAQADVEAVLAGSADAHPRELVQDLTRTVLRATGGKLRDDATVLCFDWYGTLKH
jgi:serine phosphatase RsbU (regulator of sigma subunit)